MPANTRSEIAIIGAGPAGTTAAISLWKKGIPCALIDQYYFPREKICGDGLSGKVINTLNKLDPEYIFQLRDTGLAADSWSVRFYAPSSKMVDIDFRPSGAAFPPGLICRRSVFDHFLLEKAIVHPEISFYPGVNIKKISRLNNGKCQIKNEDGSWQMETDIILMACGANRGLISALDPAYPDTRNEGIGIRAYFNNVSGCSDRNAIEMHFLRELLPWYLWIFPCLNQSANVGLALPMYLAKKNPLSLKQLLFHLIEKYPYLKTRFEHATILGKPEAHRIPFYNDQILLAGDNYMLLGDAARLVDPFTGEGISNAMISGMTAAEVVSECYIKKDYRSGCTMDYQKRIYGKLKKGLDTGLRLHHLSEKPNLLNLIIGRASNSLRIKDLLTRMLFDSNTKSKLSSRLFHLKVFLRL